MFRQFVHRLESGVVSPDECGLFCLEDDSTCAFYVHDVATSSCFMGNPNNDPAASVADTTVTDNQQIQILDGKGTST